ncbi:MAG: hypothetical protein FH748_04400 [Balneolaceae bacterium]|nr:hypothetical protein [Balneolaceae bacterium]
MYTNTDLSLINALEVLGMGRTSLGLKWVSEKENEKDENIYLALEQADKLEAKAVYFRYFSNENRPPRPQIYIYEEEGVNADQNIGADTHHKLWNAGIVPYCFIFSVSEFLVFNCGETPDGWNKESEQFTTNPHDIINLASNVQKKIQQYHARQFDSGLFWDSDTSKNFKYRQSAYEQLLIQLKNAKNHIIETVGHNKALLVKRVLMMLILLKYLEDRRDEEGNSALRPEEFYKDYNPKNPTLEGVLENSEKFTAMLSELSSKEHFNGQIFRLTKEEEEELKEVKLNVFQLFVRGDASIFPTPKQGLGELTLWRLYQFNYLPIELISHIYEDFLANKNGKKKKGVVYTPPYLVQFLIDQNMPLNIPKEQFKVLDPACGSGIFLVGAFKRMIQWWRVKNNWITPTKKNIDDLKNLLNENIYGCDLEKEAITLTYFSLGLALLDALSPKEIWGNVHFDNLIEQNLYAGDFFETLQEKKLPVDFDLVIGNPPFDSNLTSNAATISESASKENPNRPSVPDNQIALLFLEQSFNLLKEQGTCCLILPSGPLLYNTKVHEFRKYLFEKHYFKSVFDFTPLRAKLFIGSSSSAKPAVVAILAEKASPNGNALQHLIFRRTKASSEKIEFEIDHYDIHWTSYNQALTMPEIWQSNFMGGGRLNRVVEKLSERANLETFLEERINNNNWKVAEGWIESPNAKGVSKVRYLSNKKELTTEEEEEFEKLKSKHEASWITGHPFIETNDLTENGIEETNRCTTKYFYRSAKRNKEIFQPPHLLVKESVTGNKIAVVYSNQYLTFKDQIIGIHAPNKFKGELKKLKNYLSNSYNVALMWLTSAKMITSREAVANKIDILSLPYYEENLKLNSIEKILLDDILKYYSEFRKRGEKSKILNSTEKSDLNDFGSIYCEILNSIYDDFKSLTPVIGKEFIAYPFVLGDKPEIKLPDTIDKIEEKLKTLINHQVSYNLWVKRIIKAYQKNVIILYKPNQKRYWLKSIAVRDADETLADLYRQGK